MTTLDHRTPVKAIARVPAVTTFFWIIKVLATTVGETFADFLNTNLNLGLTGTSLVMGAVLVVVLVVQFALRRYVPLVYWLVVVLISVVGTLITDNLTDNVGVSLVTSTIVFAIALAVTFALWYRLEGSLSMKSITTASREAFYWLAILWTFALGTAAGDLFAERINWGYGASGLFFAAIIAACFAGWKSRVLGEVLAFWIAYVVTRPLGASIGDFLAQPKNAGGNGLGTTTTSVVFLALIAVTVAYLAISHRDEIAVPTLAVEGESDGNTR
jgi:uncharacterized membrane-anchored protein